jgi:hypothetical protein
VIVPQMSDNVMTISARPGTRLDAQLVVDGVHYPLAGAADLSVVSTDSGGDRTLTIRHLGHSYILPAVFRL